VRYSVGLPQTVSGEEMVRFARRAEELGFAGLWTMDSAIGGPTGHNPTVDGLHALSYVAPETDAIRLGIAVIVMPRRNPLLLARELATLDRLSDGRLTVGVGLGGGKPEDAAPLGFAADRPVRRLTEASPSCARRGPQRRRPSRASSIASPTCRSSPSRCSGRTRRSGLGRAWSRRCGGR
jgi:alkanesulfonate monooxygenase SsuD/methylene tetrahydromethanopterin reductase-like flavin-dependent oxidoreductase (luciferase family)